MYPSANKIGGLEPPMSDIDAQGLEQLGYKQELSRVSCVPLELVAWSSSFLIVSWFVPYPVQ